MGKKATGFQIAKWMVHFDELDELAARLVAHFEVLHDFRGPVFEAMVVAKSEPLVERVVRVKRS